MHTPGRKINEEVFYKKEGEGNCFQFKNVLSENDTAYYHQGTEYCALSQVRSIDEVVIRTCNCSK